MPGNPLLSRRTNSPVNRMKHAILITCVILAAAVPAWGFTEIERGELLLSTSASATYDSRVLGGTSGADDLIFTLFPQFLYKRDQAAQLKLDGHAGVRINRYYDFTQFDSEDFTAGLNLRLPKGVGPRFSGSFSVNYDERSDVNYDVNQRVREHMFTTNFSGNYLTSLKTSLDFDAGFLDAQRNIYSDRQQWGGGIGFNYRDFLHGTSLHLKYRHLDNETSGDNPLNAPLNQQLDTYSIGLSRPIYADVTASVSYGYRFLDRSRAETITGQTHYEGSFFAASLEGPFLPPRMFPKLTSSLSLSYQSSDVPGINDTNTRRFAGSANLSWQARETTRVFFNARRAQDLTINDITVDANTVSLGVRQEIGHFIDGTAVVGYDHRAYRGFNRSDDAFFFEARAGYRVTKYWSASAAYRFRNSDSDAVFADYSRHIVSLSANYTF